MRKHDYIAIYILVKKYEHRLVYYFLTRFAESIKAISMIATWQPLPPPKNPLKKTLFFLFTYVESTKAFQFRSEILLKKC